MDRLNEKRLLDKSYLKIENPENLKKYADTVTPIKKVMEENLW